MQDHLYLCVLDFYLKQLFKSIQTVTKFEENTKTGFLTTGKTKMGYQLRDCQKKAEPGHFSGVDCITTNKQFFNYNLISDNLF